MAEQEIKLTIKWENNNYFEMTQKKNTEPVIKIVRIEENAHISALWGNVTGLCINQLSRILAEIGEDMIQ